MTVPQAPGETPPPVLHVFEQDGGWHWGITIPRSKGYGFKVISFSQETFPTEGEARSHGTIALAGSTEADAIPG